MELTNNAKEVLSARILQKDESYLDMCNRVASYVAGTFADEEIFKYLIFKQKFLPNSPCLMGAGTDLPQLCACFVLDVEDSMESIFKTLYETAMIHKSGGGTGCNFSNLRATDSAVRSTQGVASGPVSFMKIFNAATEQVKQGGRRKGANMGILDGEHPDIFRFLTAKSCEGDLNNFNISVMLSDRVFTDPTDWDRKVLSMAARQAWHNGEPGFLFRGNINRHSPHKEVKMRACNPCGEFAALPYEPCVLGSMNLTKYIKGSYAEAREFDWLSFYHDARHATRFLDRCITRSQFPLQEVRRAAEYRRKIGLGFMGLADTLFMLRLPYDSSEGRAFAADVTQMLNKAARDESYVLGQTLGIPSGNETYRNACRLAIAPTGTLSLIANCSNGIEPLFSFNHKRIVLEGKELIETNPYLKEALLAHNASSRDELPQHLQQVFKTAPEIDPLGHIRMQAAIQKYVDQGVSKTINLPRKYPADQTRGLIQYAWEKGCKGLTIYRAGSREEEVYCPLCD